MPISFPSNPSSGNTYDFGGIHYIYNGDGWVNKSIYGISAGSGISFANYNGTGPVVISVIGGSVGATGATGATGAGGALGYWGSFWSTQDQQAAGTTGAYPITYNNTDPDSNGVSIVSNSQITFSYPGVYNIEFSAQADRVSGSGTDTIDIWFRKNGTDIPDSNGIITVSGNAAAAKTIAAWNYMSQVNANDYVELMWRTSDTRLEFIADTAGTNPTRPAIPSVILTAHQVMYTQLGPTGPTGPMPTDYVSSFNGKTGAVQGVSSINGATGEIINVAKTDEQNNFTVMQEFSGSPVGISAIQINTEYLISNSNVLQLAGGYDELSKIIIDGTYEDENIVITAGSSEIDIRDAEILISSAEINIGSETYTYISGDEVTISAYAPEGPNSGIVSLLSNDVEVVNIHSNGVTFNANINAPNIVNSINGNTGDISNVAFTNTAQSFTGLQQFTQGISGSGGITFNSDVNINVDNSLVVATITNTAGGKSQLDIDNRASSRVAIGDYDGGGNSTYIFLRDNVSNLQISNPYGAIDIGDPGAIDAGNYISYSSPDATLYGNNSNIDGFVGATFSGNISVNTASLGRTGTNNLIFGVNAGKAITTGSSNTIIGDDSGELISSGTNNTSLGYEALTALTTGSANTAVGMWALLNGTTGNNNTAIGSRALRSNTTGNDNTAIGYYALDLNQTGSANIAIGGFALSEGATSAANNIAIGYASLLKNTTGSQNVAIGRDAVRNNTTASDNVGIGYQSLYSANSGGANTAIGTNTGYRLTTGTNNTAIGYQALFGSASVTSQANTAVGYNSMVSNTSGSYNSGIGLGSLYSLTSGQQNTAVGTESLYAITNTSNNTAVGQLALRYATQGSNNTAIGILAGAYKTASNTNLTAIGSDNVYIGSEARASGDSINNEIVIGSNALGLGANTAVIGATAQVSATIYGTLNLPGGLSAAGGTFSSNVNINAKTILGSTVLGSATPGCIEFDGNNLYAGTTGGRGLIETPHISYASSLVSLSGITAYQSIFSASSDVITLAANTSYMVEGHIVVQSGTTTHTTALRLTNSVVANSPIFRLIIISTAAAAGTVARAQDMVYFETSGGVINATSGSARVNILLRGAIVTVDSVTITPQIAFSANPGNTNQIQEGSWIKFTPVGTNTVTSIGPWA